MGKKVALLVGVSKYENESNLPACEKDIGIISKIISGSECYDDFLTLDNNEKSATVKSEISSFIRKHQDDPIDEVFFYYTGHGASATDDFLYLFSDFSNKKIEQTSLRNSELDSMLRSLGSKQTIKVVDACQAGTEYIKSTKDIRSILEKSSSQSFNKTYFFFSSSRSQPSIALNDFSVFTKSFAMSFINYEGDEIRYRDIMDYISDDVNVKKYQTPLFIQQSDNTEVFCNVSSDLINLIKENINLKNDSSEHIINQDSHNEVEHSEEENLINSIRSKSKDYCNAEEASEALNFYFNSFNSYRWNGIISSLFEVEIKELSDYSGLSGMSEIGKWLKDSEENYFAEATYGEQSYEAKEKIVSEDRFGFNKTTEYRPVTKYRDIIEGVKITASTPSNALVILLTPKEEVLNWYKLFFVHIFSKSKLTVFYKYEIESEISWDYRSIQNNNNWKIKHCNLKDHKDISNIVESSISDLEAEIISSISQRFSE